MVLAKFSGDIALHPRKDRDRDDGDDGDDCVRDCCDRTLLLVETCTFRNSFVLVLTGFQFPCFLTAV